MNLEPRGSLDWEFINEMKKPYSGRCGARKVENVEVFLELLVALMLELESFLGKLLLWT